MSAFLAPASGFAAASPMLSRTASAISAFGTRSR
jgi:hypothetical protein